MTHGLPRVIRRSCVALGIVACLGVLGLSVVSVVAPRRDGILALAQVFAPYLFLALLVLLPFALLRGREARMLRLLLAVSAVVFLVRFLPASVALPRSLEPGALAIPVATWNLELGQADPAVVVETIRQLPDGLVGLEELTPRHADPIAADPAIRLRFPYQALRPRGGSDGLGLLSSWPIADGWTFRYDPPILSATVAPEAGRTMAVVVAHPYRGVLVDGPFGLPRYDTGDRDAAMAVVRQAIGPILAVGTPLVMLGDFNIVDREVGYDDLAAGLIDAQHAVGLGPGLTWRPETVEWLPFGLLRIDYVWSANGIKPIDIGPDCTPRGSDHCLLRATLELPQGP
jgi:vancomycin resistance protein VanJ